jgi:hypothetical protein
MRKITFRFNPKRKAMRKMAKRKERKSGEQKEDIMIEGWAITERFCYVVFNSR